MLPAAAVQELNDKRLTLIEGTALSERDLARARAEGATACLLLADRFSPKPEEEDLNLQFQVELSWFQVDHIMKYSFTIECHFI